MKEEDAGGRGGEGEEGRRDVRDRRQLLLLGDPHAGFFYPQLLLFNTKPDLSKGSQFVQGLAGRSKAVSYVLCLY